MTTREIKTKTDIEECFQRAAQTEKRRRVEGVGPSKGGNSMPAYVHSFADKNGWGGERLAEERKDFFKLIEIRITPQDITAMEECERWTAYFLDNPKHRRALWAWAASKVGGMKFKAWCAREGTNVKTARQWKNAAVDRIYGRLVRSDAQRTDCFRKGGFTESPVSTYLPATVENSASERRRPSWRDDESLEPVFDEPRRHYFRDRDAKPSNRPEERGGIEREKNKAA